MEETSALQTIGRYHVLEELGRGGMAVVYKGFDPLIGRTVALKTIAFGVVDATVTDLRQRLYREACAAGTLTHPNIVTIYDVIEMGGATAVAMEFIEGRTLADEIRELAPMKFDAALDIFEQICAALDYAGGRDIVHRDIKPANVMITPEGRVKVADFGVARIGVSHLTQSGTVVGSPSYMSPEQVRGLSLDPRSDLFSATVVLYEMLTKERPFAGSDVATTMYRIVHEPPTPPTQFNPGIGPAMVSVFERGLAKEPGQRYRSGAEICRDLRQAISASSLSQTITMPAMKTGPRSRRGLMLGVMAAGVAILAGGLLLVGGRGTPPEPEQQTVAQADKVTTTGTATETPAPAVVPTEQPREPEPAVSTPVTTPAPSGTAAQTGAVASPIVRVPLTGPQSQAPAVSAPVSSVPPPKQQPAASTPRPSPTPTSAPVAQTPSQPAPASAIQTPPVAASAPVPQAQSAAASAPVAQAPPPAASAPVTQVASQPSPAAPVEAASAEIQVSFEGEVFPVTVYADGSNVGRLSSAEGRVEVPAGRTRLRFVNESVFLDQDLGSVTLRSGERRRFTVPAVASASVVVRGESYQGLRIVVDGRTLPGPYPAQIPRISAGSHRIVFRWAEAALAGVEVTDTIDLSGGRVFLIRAVPENAQVVVQKLR